MTSVEFHAQSVFTRQVAFDLTTANITVNSVAAPGPVATPEFLRNTNEPLQAGYRIHRVARASGHTAGSLRGGAYLLSPEALFITGATLDIKTDIEFRE